MLQDQSAPVPAILRGTFPESKIIAAIPAYNEGATIGSVVLKVRQFATDVVVVDDGSTDDTAETAGLAGAHVIRHARNLGKGMAIRSAWLYAREKELGAFVLLDGDHQHDPKDIPRLLGPIFSGSADVTLGVRWGKTSGMPLYRRIGKRVLDFATATATKSGFVTDSQCGYRAFSPRALLELEPAEAGLVIESQMLLEAQERGLRIAEVYVDARYDVDGSTYSPGRHGLGILGRLVYIVSQRRPLFFFGLTGVGLIVVAAFLAILTARVYYSSGVFATGYAFLFVLLAIVGVLSAFVGIILNAIKQMLRGTSKE